MKPARKLTVAVITAATLLAGAPAALAATAQTGQPAAGTAVTPNTFKWLPQPGSYPTQSACQTKGRYIVAHVNNNYTFSCVRLNEGDYFVWKLFIGVPQ